MPALVNMPPRYVDFPTRAEEQEARDQRRREAISAQLYRLHDIATDIALLVDRGDDSLRGADSHEATEYEPLIAEAQALFSKVWRTVGPPDARARSLITTDPMEAA